MEVVVEMVVACGGGPDVAFYLLYQLLITSVSIKLAS